MTLSAHGANHPVEGAGQSVQGLALGWLQLFQLISANLPVGSFTYSQGLEWAVEAGWVKGADGFEAWLTDQVDESLVFLDWPLLKRLHQAALADDEPALEHWTQLLLASRESEELRLEETQRGQALCRVLKDWALSDGPLPACLSSSQLAGFAWAGARLGLNLEQLALGWGFALIESAVMAGIKLVPLGQQAGQGILRRVSGRLPAQLATAWALADDELGGGLPRLAIASSCHEIQYTRLFRS